MRNVLARKQAGAGQGDSLQNPSCPRVITKAQGAHAVERTTDLVPGLSTVRLSTRCPVSRVVYQAQQVGIHQIGTGMIRSVPTELEQDADIAAEV